MLTKIFSALQNPKPLDRATALACLASNVTVLPGLGSLLAGKRVGFFQALLGLSGFGLSLGWGYSFVMAWIESGRLPLEGGPRFHWGVVGSTLWLAAWIWSIMTGRALLREVEHQRLEKPPRIR